MADAASPDLAAADLLAGFALGAPLQNPEAGPVGQLASGHSNGGGNAARGKDAQEGGAQPGSECGNGVRGDPAAPPPFADAAAAVQQAMVMVQREQVNFAFRDGLGKRGRKNKEAEADRIAERKRAQTEAAPLIAPILQPATEHMPPGAPDAQTRQGVPFIPQPSVQLLPQMKHAPPFQSPAYKHPTSEGGKWESTIAGPLPPAHIDRATALEEAKRLAANSGTGAPIQAPFFHQPAEAPFPGMGDTVALAPFPNGGGVLERGLRRHLKAQGPQRPRPRRLGPASPSKVVGDGPIGNLCSAAFAADSSSYAIGRAAVGAALQTSLQSAQGAAAQPPPRQPPPLQIPPLQIPPLQKDAPPLQIPPRAAAPAIAPPAPEAPPPAPKAPALTT